MLGREVEVGQAHRCRCLRFWQTPKREHCSGIGAPRALPEEADTYAHLKEEAEKRYPRSKEGNQWRMCLKMQGVGTGVKHI